MNGFVHSEPLRAEDRVASSSLISVYLHPFTRRSPQQAAFSRRQLVLGIHLPHSPHCDGGPPLISGPSSCPLSLNLGPLRGASSSRGSDARPQRGHTSFHTVLTHGLLRPNRRIGRRPDSPWTGHVQTLQPAAPAVAPADSQ